MFKKQLLILLSMLMVTQTQFAMEQVIWPVAEQEVNYEALEAVAIAADLDAEEAVQGQENAQEQNVRISASMDTKSKVITLSPAGLATMASGALFEKFALKKTELQKAPAAIKRKFIESVLLQHVEQSYVTQKEIRNSNSYNGDRTLQNVVTNMPIKELPSNMLLLNDTIGVRENFPDNLEVVNIETNTVIQTYPFMEDEKNSYWEGNGRVVDQTYNCSINGVCKIITWDSKTQKSTVYTVPGNRLIACIANEYFVVSQMQIDGEHNVLWHKNNYQLEEVGVIKGWVGNLNNTKDVFTFADNSMHLVDMQTGVRIILPIQVVLRDDFSLCEISENKLIAYTPNDTLAVWDMERNELISETPLRIDNDNVIMHQVLDENYMVVSGLNGNFHVWDIKHNKSILELNVPEHELLCTMHHGNLFVLHENCLKLWDAQSKKFTTFQKNVEASYRTDFSEAYIFVGYGKGIKIWDTHSLALLYQDNYITNSYIQFYEKKDAFITPFSGEFELPVSLTIPLPKVIDQLSDEQVQYVFDVLCYLDGVFCSDSEQVKEFTSKEFNALPGLIQRLLCNYFKAQAQKKQYSWHLVDGKKAVYQVTKIVPELVIEYRDRIEYRNRSQSAVYRDRAQLVVRDRIENKDQENSYVDTFLKVGTGAAIVLVGALAYKWFANNSNE